MDDLTIINNNNKERSSDPGVVLNEDKHEARQLSAPPAINNKYLDIKVEEQTSEAMEVKEASEV